jgi:hypothetical protein
VRKNYVKGRRRDARGRSRIDQMRRNRPGDGVTPPVVKRREGHPPARGTFLAGVTWADVDSYLHIGVSMEK